MPRRNTTLFSPFLKLRNETPPGREADFLLQEHKKSTRKAQKAASRSQTGPIPGQPKGGFQGSQKTGPQPPRKFCRKIIQDFGPWGQKVLRRRPPHFGSPFFARRRGESKNLCTVVRWLGSLETQGDPRRGPRFLIF